MSLDKAGYSWLRKTFAWSNSWTSWQERLVLFFFLAVAGGLAWLSVAIGQAYGPTFGVVISLTLVWLSYFVALSVCSWLGWLKLFGPVLFYDMVRTARRSRYIFIRLFYASVLLTILCVLFFSVSDMVGRHHHFERDRASREAAIIAETFFFAFMIVQLTLVVLLTPAYVAGAIAEEKERKTLEFMLATDLDDQEIVLSKFLSRIANLTLLLLTGLPILSILQFVGGVDAQLMLSGFAATGLTMLGIASVGILLSVQFQKPRDAIGLTYIFIITYLATATLFKSLELSRVPFMGWSLWFGDGEPTWGDVSRVLNAGNPIAAIIEVVLAIEGAARGGAGLPGSFLETVLPELLTNFTYFHLTIFVACITWSIVRMRAIALTQSSGGTTKKLSWWERHRPAIGEMPMFWKELHIEGRMKLNWLMWGVMIVLVLLTLGTGLFIVGLFAYTHIFEFHPMQFWEFAMAMNVWFRIAGTGVMCLMLLIVAVRASTSIAAERERDTFDALITTPMNAETILGAKLIGSLMSLRMGWLWFGSMAALAILTGGVHPLAMPIVLGMWFVYATFFTMIGMWFSMVCKTSMRATVYTVLTTLLLGGGHWVVIGFCCYFPIATIGRHGPNDGIEVVAKFQTAMTPPATLALYSFSWENLANDFRHEDWAKHVMVFSLFGLVLWSAACMVMWFGVLVPKFKQIARREELIYE